MEVVGHVVPGSGIRKTFFGSSGKWHTGTQEAFQVPMGSLLCAKLQRKGPSLFQGSGTQEPKGF